MLTFLRYIWKDVSRPIPFDHLRRKRRQKDNMYGESQAVTSSSQNGDTAHTGNLNRNHTYENAAFELEGTSVNAASVVVENDHWIQYANAPAVIQADVIPMQEPRETEAQYVNVKQLPQRSELDGSESSDEEDFEMMSKFRRCASSHSDTGNQLNKTSTSQGGGDGDHYDDDDDPTIVENVLCKPLGHLDSTLVNRNIPQTSSTTLTCQGGDDGDDPTIVENVLYKPLGHSEHLDNTLGYDNIQQTSGNTLTCHGGDDDIDTTIVENDLYV